MGAERDHGAVARVDPRRGAVTRATAFGERPGPIAAAGGDLWVGVGAGGAQHRGGTLTVAFGGAAEPAYDPAMGGPPPVLGLTNDGSASSWDTSGFCDPAIDRRIARAQALQTTDPTRANIRWARLDRALTDRAVWLPTVTPKDTNVVSRRTGNYHHHPFLGPLIDQLWVR